MLSPTCFSSECVMVMCSVVFLQFVALDFIRGNEFASLKDFENISILFHSYILPALEILMKCMKVEAM